MSRKEDEVTGRPVTTPAGDQAVQDKAITLNGLRFHYREWGNASAPPLILLHGFLCHARMYDPLARVMSDRYRVLALDQRGHGETDWAKAYEAELVFADAAAFIQALELPRVSLVGYSFGGAVAYRYAARYPERVARLVIVESGGGAATPSPEWQAVIRGWRDVPRTFDTPEEAERALREVVPHAVTIEFQRFIRDGLTQQVDGRWTWRWDPLVLQGKLAPPAEVLWRSLPQIGCPTLFVRGKYTELVPVKLAEKIVAMLPLGQLANIPDAGHFPWFDNPTATVDVIRNFFLKDKRRSLTCCRGPRTKRSSCSTRRFFPTEPVTTG